MRAEATAGYRRRALTSIAAEATTYTSAAGRLIGEQRQDRTDRKRCRHAVNVHHRFIFCFGNVSLWRNLRTHHFPFYEK